MNVEELEAAARMSESERVLMNRYNEARRAGLTKLEAARFARSDVDVGLLRKLVAHKCPPKRIAEIVL